jgi:hypothetical protein
MLNCSGITHSNGSKRQSTSWIPVVDNGIITHMKVSSKQWDYELRQERFFLLCNGYDIIENLRK